MADKMAPVVMHGMRMVGENYDDLAKTGRSIKDGIKRAASGKKPNGDNNNNNDDDDVYYYSSRARAKSAGDYYDRERRGRRRDSYYDYDSYDSEASVPPINRRRGGPSSSTQQDKSSNTQSSQLSTRRSARSSSSSGSSSSSSSTDTDDLGSSTDDEKKQKSMRRGELISGGLAAVASVHAAGTVWSSMNARDAREEAVAAGELTKEEAKRERRKNQFQDVAALGLAALAIKGAYGKWKGTAAQHQSKKQHEKEKAERHAKRVAKGVDRESRRQGGGRAAVEGAPQRKQITDGRPGYSRRYSQSEADLSRGGRGYDDYYDDYNDPRYDERRGRGMEGYSRRV